MPVRSLAEQPAKIIAPATSATRPRKSRRLTQASHPPNSASSVMSLCWNECRGPLSQIQVLLVERVDLHDERLSITTHGEAIHVSCRATLDERTIRAIVRVVLRAYEFLVIRAPAQRRILVRAGERECVDLSRRARDDDAVIAIDRHAVRRRHRVALLLVAVAAPFREGPDLAQRHCLRRPRAE